MADPKSERCRELRIRHKGLICCDLCVIYQSPEVVAQAEVGHRGRTVTVCWDCIGKFEEAKDADGG